MRVRSPVGYCATRAPAVSAVAIGILAAKPLLGGLDQAFQYIQEYTGFITPGIVVIFILGMFWKQMTTAGALIAAGGSIVLSLAIKFILPTVPSLPARLRSVASVTRPLLRSSFSSARALRASAAFSADRSKESASRRG